MKKIVISFTSYPQRIGTIHRVLDTIIKQTVLPDRIILYLSSSEFEETDELPDFSKYEKYGFDIRWNEENLRSHKKWFYSFQEFREDIVITIDDDILYNNDMIEKLLQYHQQFPKCVIARNGHLITCSEKGLIAPYDDWCNWCAKYVGSPRMDMEAVGNGGVLYVPSLFESTELFRKDVFMNKCPYADDLWLKIMEIYNDIPTVLAEKHWKDSILMEHQVHCLFQDYNKNGGNDRQLKELIKAYPYTLKNEKLINSIFKKDYLSCGEAVEMKKEEMDSILEELKVKIRRCGRILIYGAGNAAHRIYSLLMESDLDIIRAFIVKNTGDNVNTIGNIDVKCYKEFLDGEEKILIALFDENQTEEICIGLIKEGIDQSRIIRLDELEKISLKERVYPIIDGGAYWEKRYADGGNSGAGSYNRLAEFKAEILNEFVKENKVRNVIEWGCGDGNQLKLAKYPMYIGFDVSMSAIKMCKEKFLMDATKKFIWCGGENFKNNDIADLAISLDVIFHLVENGVYEQYMKRLFSSSRKFVCIYASNFDEQTAEHVKNRKFTDWVETHVGNRWKLLKVVQNKYPYSENDLENTSWSDFYFYELITEKCKEK